MLPTKPINTDYLHNYSRDLALKLSNKFFANTDIITGEQILEFSNIKQINFLIFKILEERWEAEALRLESPFFDYNQAEVQDGLRTFLNVLSRHIRVQKKAFTAILMEAVYGTLLLVLDPRTFYEQEIQKPAKLRITAETYRRSVKYIQYNREIFKTFVGELALRHTEAFAVEDALVVWQHTLRDHWRYIEPIEWRIKAFDNLLELSMDSIYTRATEVEVMDTEILPAETENEEETKQELEDLPAETESKEEPDTEEDKQEESILPFDAEIKEEEGVFTPLTNFPDLEEDKEEEDIVFAPLANFPDEEEEIAEKSESLVEDLSPTFENSAKEDDAPFFAEIGEPATPLPTSNQNSPTNAEVDPTIAGRFRQERVSSLLDAIPLHEKFTFIDELFGGDNLAFQDALEKIDHSPNYEEARRLTNQYILQFNWDFDRDSTQDFLAWLGRRF